MRKERQFNKFLKERFLRDMNGFSLAEIMVAAGILGMISLGVMQMTQNLQKNQKKFQYDAEINDFIMKLQMGLRDKAACERTFAGATDPANDPAALQPATVHNNAITPDYNLSTAIIQNIYSGNVDAGGNAKVIATSVAPNNQYGAIGGRFQVQDIRLFDTVAPAAMNELVEARVALRIRKLGAVDDQGDGDPSNDILKGAWGRAEIVKTFSIMVSVWHNADPNLGANIPGTIRSCYVQEDFYVQGACNAIGGRLDTDGACKNIVLGKFGETYNDPMLDNESLNFQLLVDGNTRVKNTLEVGYDSGDATPVGDKDDPVILASGAPVATGWESVGSAVIQNFMFLGFPSESGEARDVPLAANDNNEAPGSIVTAGNLMMYATPNENMPTMTNGMSGTVLNEGSIYTGFASGDNLTATGIGGTGGPGEIVAAQGMTVRNKGNAGYGINIVEDGAGANKFLLRVGTNAGFTDPGAADTLRLAGNDGGTVQSEGHLRIGPNTQAAQVSGGAAGIGINTPKPAANLHVTGTTQVDGDLDVNGNGNISGHLILGSPSNNQVSGDGFADNWAATVGWVRNRIANTLAPDSGSKSSIASDILNITFNEAGSALRVVQQNYCERVAIEDGSRGTAYSSVRYGAWVSGRCRYRIRNCGYNNHCNYVYANTGMISDGYIQTVNGYIRAYGAGGYIRAQQYVMADTYMYARSYIRGRSYLYVDSYARAQKFCIGGTAKANCITRIPTGYCDSNEKLRGVPNGWHFCAKDIYIGN